MNKTKEQVFRYVSFRDYTDSDWKEIAEWIKAKYGSGLHRARHPKINSDKDEFFRWCADADWAEGCVLICNDCIGVFHELPDRTEEGVFALVGWYDSDGVLHQEHRELLYGDSGSVWQNVDEAMTEAYYQRLHNDGYTYIVSLGALGKRTLPETNKVFKFRNNGVEGVGVIDRYMDKAAHFSVLVTDKVESDCWVPSASIEILSCKKKDVDRFHSELEQQGLHWDDGNGKLIAHIKRGVAGSTYWYINDRFGVSSDRETGSKADVERYKNRNYFLDYQEALRFRDMIYRLRGEC